MQVFMIWDQPDSQTSTKIKVSKNVKLVGLPPYSPQLDPIEILCSLVDAYKAKGHDRKICSD